MMSHDGWLETLIQTIMDARTLEENYTQSNNRRSLKTISLNATDTIFPPNSTCIELKSHMVYKFFHQNLSKWLVTGLIGGEAIAF